MSLKPSYLNELRKKQKAVKRLALLARRDTHALVTPTSMVRMHAIVTLLIILNDWIAELERKP